MIQPRYGPPGQGIDFGAQLTEARKGFLIAAVCTVLLTPFLLLAGVAGILFAAAYADLPVIDDAGFAHSLPMGLNLLMGFMFVVSLTQDGHRNFGRAVFPLGVLGGLVFLAQFTSMEATTPQSFWLFYGLGSLLFFGLLGYSYAPKDSYYLGWIETRYGPIDNPFTVKDDVDRAHFAMGFAMAAPTFLLRAYGALFGTAAMWRGLSRQEETLASEVLQHLIDRSPDAARTALRGKGSVGPSVLRLLEAMDLVRLRRGALQLTSHGRRALGARLRI